MYRSTKPRTAVLAITLTVLGGGLPAVALAHTGSRAAKATPPPRSGVWRMIRPKGTEYDDTVVKAGRFTVSGEFVTHLQATVKSTGDCPGGAVRVAGKVPIIDTVLASGGHQWYVASGGSSVDPGHVQPAPITLTVHGKSEVNATMEIAFPAAGKKAIAASIGWGDDGTGNQNCDFTFIVKRG
jgi:hypothetical protein